MTHIEKKERSVGGRWKQILYRLKHPNASILLLITTVLVAIIANSPLAEGYFKILDWPIILQVGDFNLFSHQGETMNLLQFANDVLMVLFFLNIGLEIKQESLVGHLSSFKRAMHPVVAAVGGMIIPVLLYLLVCHDATGIKGTAIPMATDIAFALAIISSIKGVSPMLKTFLATLAVADDIGGILVIALFYTSYINVTMLLFGIAVIAAVYLLGRCGVTHLWAYGLGLIVTWFFFLHSGVHTTLAGVLIGFVMPVTPKIKTVDMVERLKASLNLFPEDALKLARRGVIVLPREQLKVINSIQTFSNCAVSPAQRMERKITSMVNYLILPLFAFVNAGISFKGVNMGDLMGVPLAIFIGLFLGKPIGIFFFSKLYMKLTKSAYPDGMDDKSLIGVSFLGGIGFTVSLFISSLSFSAPDLASVLNNAKLGILLGSAASAIAGWCLLSCYYNNKNRDQLTAIIKEKS